MEWHGGISFLKRFSEVAKVYSPMLFKLLWFCIKCTLLSIIDLCTVCSVKAKNNIFLLFSPSVFPSAYINMYRIGISLLDRLRLLFARNKTGFSSIAHFEGLSSTLLLAQPGACPWLHAGWMSHWAVEQWCSWGLRAVPEHQIIWGINCPGIAGLWHHHSLYWLVVMALHDQTHSSLTHA